MQINENHIKEAESILINGKEFDTERLNFIKKLDSCDLLAVPGSGKTTALQAKLYCIAKHLPFKDGSGILILSHTNAAVEEIEKNLKQHCPILFQYPNFVGTVQSFVNKFLANPACFEKYKTYLRTIDNDIANNRIIGYIKSLNFNNTLSTYLFFQTYNQYATISKNILEEKYDVPIGKSAEIIGLLKDQKIIRKGSLVYNKVKNNQMINNIQASLEIRNIVSALHTKATRIANKEKVYRGIKYELDFIENKFISTESLSIEADSGKILLDIYENNFTKGIARFRDCYSLAFWFIEKYPEIKKIIKHRFKYVFIDEMQDLEKFQIDILDKIFYEESTTTVMQRIGDINQSIYNSGKTLKETADWNPRNQEFLNGSYRLTPENANIVNCFTLDRQKDENVNPRFIVDGRRRLDTAIKPHLILFNTQTMGKLENQFKELIQKYSLQETPEGKKYGFKIIGWNAKWDDNEEHNGKLRLENIFATYKKEAKGNKETFDSLSKYLQLFDRQKNTLETTRKAVLNLLIHILRIEDKTYPTMSRGRENNRYYTKSEMIKHIQQKENNCNYELFKTKVYVWSYLLSVRHDFTAVFESVVKFINNEFKEWFHLDLKQDTRNFIGTQFEPINTTNESVAQTNDDNEIHIEINTVHSAKGQTHCATMYVETSYHTYETLKARIKETLKMEEHGFDISIPNNTRGIEALKMMYVGFSRPTHLLCFACLKENLSDIENYRATGWEIVDITEERAS